MLSQAQYHVARARKIDDEERKMRRRQEEEREAIRQKTLAEQTEKEKVKANTAKKLAELRAEFVEKTKKITQFDDIDDAPARKKGGRVCHSYQYREGCLNHSCLEIHLTSVVWI